MSCIARQKCWLRQTPVNWIYPESISLPETPVNAVSGYHGICTGTSRFRPREQGHKRKETPVVDVVCALLNDEGQAGEVINQAQFGYALIIKLKSEVGTVYWEVSFQVYQLKNKFRGTTYQNVILHSLRIDHTLPLV